MFAAIIGGVIASVAPVGEASAQIVLNYSHVSGSISAPFNDGMGGLLKTNPGPYRVTGNGTNTLRFVDPAVTPPNYELLAVAGLSGFMDLFRGSTASGNMSVQGTYSLAGAPAAGATGSLQGTSTYLNYIAAVGAVKLLGSGSTTITSSIGVAPFAAETPGPVPATTTLSAGFGTATAGSPNNIPVGFGNVITGATNGNYPVNVDLHVTASRTGGPVTAMASWISQDFNWTFQGAIVQPPVDEETVDPPVVEPPVTEPPPTGTPGVVIVRMENAVNPENLLVTPSGDLLYSSVDPASVSDPEAYASDGPDIGVGLATDLGYVSDLVADGSGDYLALRSFGYASGGVDLTDASLMVINPDTGTTSPVTLSGPLYTPSGLLPVDSGFGGASLLVTEMALADGTTAKLLGIDSLGTITVLIENLGVDYPVDLAEVPSGFGDMGSMVMILDIGVGSGETLADGTGGILLVDPTTQAVSVFTDGLSAPQSMSFGTGALVGDPTGTYLYVLEQGDQDPVTGVLEGNGALVAYDATGVRHPVANSIASGTGLAGGPTGDEFYFSDGDAVYMVEVPEPGGSVALSSALLGIAARGRGRGRTLRGEAGVTKKSQ